VVKAAEVGILVPGVVLVVEFDEFVVGTVDSFLDEGPGG